MYLLISVKLCIPKIKAGAKRVLVVYKLISMLIIILSGICIGEPIDLYNNKTNLLIEF